MKAETGYCIINYCHPEEAKRLKDLILSRSFAYAQDDNFTRPTRSLIRQFCHHRYFHCRHRLPLLRLQSIVVNER